MPSLRNPPLAAVLLLLPAVAVPTRAEVVTVGAGSYTTDLPPGAKAPQSEIFRTDAVKGHTPTNDWWSSVAWTKFYAMQQFNATKDQGLSVLMYLLPEGLQGLDGAGAEGPQLGRAVLHAEVL